MEPTIERSHILETDLSGASRAPAIIQKALKEIIHSAPFRKTRQCQDLLQYVVEHTLAGQDETLRERVIGVEVFGRKTDYDTSEDPVVRLRAAEVRKRLAQFYQNMDGVHPAVRIDMPSGSYRATFEWAISVQPQSQTIASPDDAASTPFGKDVEVLPLKMSRHSDKSAEAPGAKTGNASPKWSWIAGLVVLLLLVGAGAFTRRPGARSKSDFDQFWSPILSGSKPVLICMGSNVVYQISHEFMVHYLEDRHLGNQSTETFVDLPPDTPIPAGDVHRAKDSFVALGDVAAVSDLVAMLAQRGKSYQQRFPPDISFAELQNNPTILIGGFNNQLTMVLTKDLRFVLAKNSRIEDRQDGSRSWSVQLNGAAGDARDTEDYAVISRLLNSQSGGPLISIAGIGQYGTQAAAQFVSNPQMIAGLVKNAPAGWDNKNLQVVLHIKVIDFRPISTEVVGVHYW
jgi:hypothetical protein